MRDDLKVCARCNLAKAVDLFGKDKSKKDGKLIYCKQCHKARMDAVREIKRARDREEYKKYREERLAKVKAYNSTHKEEKKQYDQVYGPGYRKKTQQIRNIRTMNYRARRLKLTDPPGWRITAEWWDGQLLSYEGRCAYQHCTSEKKLTIEHVMPMARGGRHSADNIVPACTACNYSKRDRTIEEMGWRLRPTAYTSGPPPSTA